MMPDQDWATRAAAASRAARLGALIAVLTVLFGFGLGGVFGFKEAIIKSALAARATAVTATVYHGDPAAAKPVLDKAWTYMQRAHLHAGAIGTTALVLIATLVLAGVPTRAARITSLLLGIGALGYSVFWLWAGFLAPKLGGTGAAKEALRWLAIPSAGALLIGTLCTAVLLARAMRRT